MAYTYSNQEESKYHLKNFIETFSFPSDLMLHNNICAYNPYVNFFGNNLRYIIKKFVKSGIHLTSTQGMRLDILSYRYYGTTSLWWIIHSCSPDVLNPFVIPIGTSIYIPRQQDIDDFISFFNSYNSSNSSATGSKVLHILEI